MADVTGARTTTNITQSVRRVDMESKILLLEPDVAPLTVLSGRLPAKPTVNPEYSWVEDASEARFDTTTATALSTDTTVKVTTGANFEQHMLVKVPRTGEVFRVTAISTNDLTVVRGIGSTKVALNNGEELLIIGSAQPEGDTSRAARSNNPVKKTNYTQILRMPWESTETLRHSDTFTEPKDWEYNAQKKGIEHKKDLEYTYWHGHPSEDTSGSTPRRTTGGVLHYITTNITAVGGTLTEAVFWAALRTAFRFGSPEKYMFSSGLVTGVLNAFPRGKIQVIQSDQDTTYGLRITRFISPFGTLNLVNSWLFEGTTLGGYAAIVDMKYVRKRPLANSEGSRDTHIRDNIQAPDADTMKSEYLTEAGLEFGQEKAHALLTGITG